MLLFRRRFYNNNNIMRTYARVCYGNAEWGEDITTRGRSPRVAISFPTGPSSVRWTTERVVCVFTSKTMSCAMRLRLFTFRWHRSEKIKSNRPTKPSREHVQQFVSTNSRTWPASASYIFFPSTRFRPEHLLE